MTAKTATATVDPDEIEKFAAIADQWWDAEGEFKPLHMLNPVRIGYIRDRLCARFGRDPLKPKPLAGLKVCDIGCGGGLICEPLSRLGADVTGVDATGRSIDIALNHAERMGLDIRYRHATADELVEEGAQFDAVINMEVVEHVADLHGFLADAAALVRPGGAMALSTFNRTAKSFAMGIVGAEYILRWLPRGTHNWRKFVKPSELAAGLRPTGMEISDLCGMAYSPVRDEFHLAPRDVAVNYLAFAVKPR
ncbi:MAG: bifunctional 2-polyprenyl-6-hydroxyphenol methylase/3-demethylubiquinol 3-O-methyltransferase UbiG [Alphaproteobacteria bacterium]|nr:bifunctional 2-polyprenyl-6-hydroxyphenol methylase/3-demethylubiquinol 3-O-methyltransferase UbiG [Alphaproteobacteria bacterium]